MSRAPLAAALAGLGAAALLAAGVLLAQPTAGAIAGRTIDVPPGGDLQAALDRARPGDVIALAPGAIYTGPFTLPRKDGDDWIVIRAREADALPPAGHRVSPADARVMPRIVSASGSAIVAAKGAHHWRLVGLEIAPSEGAFLYDLVQLGTKETSRDDFPHHIVIERCYLHGDPTKGTRRGIAMNSRDTTVIDSYLSDFKEQGNDSQAIAGWAGPGPYRIVDNHLEAAGENVMFGGGDPAIRDLIPSDIEIRGNHFTKPVTWKQGDPAYLGVPWTIKNLLELKNARRVRIEGNLFERNWAQAQTGVAILFTTRNEEGTASWSAVEKVEFVNNVVRDSGGGINILGRDDNHPGRSGRTQEILIANNLFERIGATPWDGSGTLFLIHDGARQVTITHNTGFHKAQVIMAEAEVIEGFTYTDNVTPHNEYGVIGSGTGVGLPTLKAYFPGAVFTRNVLAGGDPKAYPPGNWFPHSMEKAGFVNLASGCYRLGDRSDYRNAGGDGKAAGADLSTLCSAMTPGDRPGSLCGSGCLTR